MNKTVHYVGLDVHKETIAVSIAPAGTTEVRPELPPPDSDGGSRKEHPNEQ